MPSPSTPTLAPCSPRFPWLTRTWPPSGSASSSTATCRRRSTRRRAAASTRAAPRHSNAASRKSPRWSGRSRTTWPPATSRSSPWRRGLRVADSWVQVGIDDVDDKVHDRDRRGGHHRDRQDRRQVLLVDGSDRPLPHTLQVEDGLGDDGAPEQGAEVHPEHGDDGREACSQAVLVDDLPLGQPLDACGPDVILRHRLDQVAARHAGVEGREQQRQHDPRQPHVPEPGPEALRDRDVAGARRAVLVAAEQAPHEQPVLLPDRLVQTELALDLGDGVRRRRPARERGRRVAWRHHEEDDIGHQGDDEQHQDDPEQPPDDIAPHRSHHRLSVGWGRPRATPPLERRWVGTQVSVLGLTLLFTAISVSAGIPENWSNSNLVTLGFTMVTTRCHRYGTQGTTCSISFLSKLPQHWTRPGSVAEIFSQLLISVSTLGGGPLAGSGAPICCACCAVNPTFE